MIEWPYQDGREFAIHGNPLFGEGWEGTERGSDDDAFMTDTPVGETCAYCETLIQSDDSGELMMYVDAVVERVFRVQVVHIECSLLNTLGHDLGVCSCTRWAGATTLREASIEAMRRYRQARS